MNNKAKAKHSNVNNNKEQKKFMRVVNRAENDRTTTGWETWLVHEISIQLVRCIQLIPRDLHDNFNGFYLLLLLLGEVTVFYMHRASWRDERRFHAEILFILVLRATERNLIYLTHVIIYNGFWIGYILRWVLWLLMLSIMYCHHCRVAN